GTSRMTSRLTSRLAPGAPSSVSSWSSAGRASAGLADMGTSVALVVDLGLLAGEGRGFACGLAAADALLHLYRLAAAGDPQAAAKHGNVLGDDRHLAAEVAGEHVSRLKIQELCERQRGAAEDRRELDFRILHLFAQAVHPALVLLDPIAGDPGIEYLAHRLDHGVGHGHVQVAPRAIQLDVEGGDDHDLRRRDDVGEVRVDLGVEVLELDGSDVRPGLAQVGEYAAQHDMNDALLGRGELAPLDLGVPARAAEEVVHHGEHHLRVEHDEGGTAERIDLHEIETGRHVQGVHVLAEFLDLDRAHRDLRRAAQQVVEAHAVQAGEALVDHLERR